ncbi:hypothetical protein GOV06_00915 [Candidatus Woesearchaeota archaeon]|nr:hypothetical protein [Candidatus Woesearchaeota archaeon]
MKCDNCQKEQIWLEMIGANFYCHRCIQKHKILGLVFRTNTEAFKKIMKKLKPKNYEEYIQLERKQIEPIVNLRKYGIRLKTTNIIEL